MISDSYGASLKSMGEMRDDNKNDLLSIIPHVPCGNKVYTVSPICVLNSILLLTT